MAVIDTGVDGHHPDLIGNVLRGTDVSTGEPTGPGDNDQVGHGTAVAGLVAAHGHGPGHDDGVIGVAPDSKILPIRDGTIVGFGIIRAIDWAVARGARVLCIAQGEAENLAGLQEAIERAEKADVVVVAAAGNRPGQTSVAYPAAYPGVVAVSGTDESGTYTNASATGPEVVLAAPATNLVQPYLNGGYAEGTGTSASTGIVAGAAALVRARFPKLSAAEVIHRLTATAIDKGPPGRDVEYGYGLINIVGALTATIPPEPPSATPTPAPSASQTQQPTPTPDPSPTATADNPFTRHPLLITITIAGLLIAVALLAAWTTRLRQRRTTGQAPPPRLPSRPNSRPDRPPD